MNDPHFPLQEMNRPIPTIQTEALIPSLLYMKQLWETVSLRVRSKFNQTVHNHENDFDFSTNLKPFNIKNARAVVMPFETAIFAFFSRGILLPSGAQSADRSRASQSDWIWITQDAPSKTPTSEPPLALMKVWYGEIGATRLQSPHKNTPGFDYLQKLFQSLHEGKPTAYIPLENINLLATIRLNQDRLRHYHQDPETAVRQAHLLESLEDYLHRHSSPGLSGPIIQDQESSPLFIPHVSSGEPYHIDLLTLLGLIDSSLRELMDVLDRAVEDVIPAGFDDFDPELLDREYRYWEWLFNIISIYQKFPVVLPNVAPWIEQHFYFIPAQYQPDWMQLLLHFDAKVGEHLAAREFWRLSYLSQDPFSLRYSHQTPHWVWLGMAHAQHPRIPEYINNLLWSNDFFEIEKAIELIDALGKNALSPALHEKVIEHLIERKRTLYPQDTRAGNRVSFWMSPDIYLERDQHLQLAKILLKHGDAAIQGKVHIYLQETLDYYLGTHKEWIYSSPQRWSDHTPEQIEELQNSERRILREPIFKLVEMFQQFFPNASIDEQLLSFERCIKALPTHDGAVFEALRIENLRDQYRVLPTLFRANHPSAAQSLETYWLRVDRTEGLIPLELLEAAALSGWKLAVTALTLNFSHSLERLIQLQESFQRGKELTTKEDRLIDLPIHLTFLSATLLRLVSHPNQKRSQHTSGQFEASLDYLLQELTLDLDPTDENLSYPIHRRLTAAGLLLDLIPTIVAPTEAIAETLGKKTIFFKQTGLILFWLLASALPTQAADFVPHIVNGNAWLMGSLLLFILLAGMFHDTVQTRIRVWSAILSPHQNNTPPDTLNNRNPWKPIYDGFLLLADLSEEERTKPLPRQQATVRGVVPSYQLITFWSMIVNIQQHLRSMPSTDFAHYIKQIQIFLRVNLSSEHWDPLLEDFLTTASWEPREWANHGLISPWTVPPINTLELMIQTIENSSYTQILQEGVFNLPLTAFQFSVASSPILALRPHPALDPEQLKLWKEIKKRLLRIQRQKKSPKWLNDTMSLARHYATMKNTAEAIRRMETIWNDPQKRSHLETDLFFLTYLCKLYREHSNGVSSNEEQHVLLTKSITIGEKAVALADADADAFLELGITYYLAKQSRLSAPLLERVIQEDPENARAHLFLAFCYVYLKESGPLKNLLQFTQKMETHLQLAYRYNPENPKIKAALSRWLLGERLFEEAFKLISEISPYTLDRNIDFLLTYVRAANAFGFQFKSAGFIEKSKALFSDSLNKTMDFLIPLYQQTRSRKKQRLLEENLAGVYHVMGQAHRGLGNTREAIEALEAAIQLNPLNILYPNTLASILYEDNRLDEALEVLANASDNATPNAITHKLLNLARAAILNAETSHQRLMLSIA